MTSSIFSETGDQTITIPSPIGSDVKVDLIKPGASSVRVLPVEITDEMVERAMTVLDKAFPREWQRRHVARRVLAAAMFR